MRSDDIVRGTRSDLKQDWLQQATAPLPTALTGCKGKDDPIAHPQPNSSAISNTSATNHLGGAQFMALTCRPK